MHCRHIFKDLPEMSALPPLDTADQQNNQSELSGHTTLWTHVQSRLQVIVENS